MLAALLILIGCELLGEVLRAGLHLPLPGPVIGMLILAAGLALRNRGKAPDTAAAPSGLDRTAGALLDHMGLLFVPAGVGVIAEAGLLRQEWRPIVVALVGSTVISLAVTGLVMHLLIRRSEARAKAASPREGQSEAAG